MEATAAGGSTRAGREAEVEGKERESGTKTDNKTLKDAKAADEGERSIRRQVKRTDNNAHGRLMKTISSWAPARRMCAAGVFSCVCTPDCVYFQCGLILAVQKY